MKKNILFTTVVLLLLASMPYCKKKGSTGCTETALQVTTTPANNSTEAPSVGPNFPLRINITGGLPAAGVTIDVKARPESSQTTFFSESRSSTSAINDFNITGTPAVTASIVEITITSKSCSSNKFTGSYRYSKK